LRVVVIMFFLIVLAALGWGARGLMGSDADSRIVFPPARAGPAATDDSVLFEDFVGSEECIECHAEQHDLWLGSTHQRAGGAPSPDVVIAPFDSQPIRFWDADVIPSITEDGEYIFTVERRQHDPVVFRVDGVVGGGHMVGGGTQGFVSAFPDGKVRFLPFDFIREEALWFCNSGGRFVPITEQMRLEDCLDWPPNRIIGTERRNDTCQECHGSQILLTFDAETGRYDTKLMGFDINCESCHGPGRRHVELSDTTSLIDDTEDLDIKVLSVLNKDESLQVCFRCHALKGVVEPGYLPGRRLEKHYSLKAWLHEETPFFPDGRIRTFAYQQNHLYSDCYLNGSMTCVDCHDPHSQEYRDIWGQVLDNRFSDEQCTDCHPSKAERPQEHTFHEPGTEGSACVDCHMPYLQHPSLGRQLRFARSDHTIPIPRPGLDDRMGIVNACAQAQCHPDSTVQALEEVTREWYGELKPRKEIIDGLAQAPAVEDRLTAADLLLHPETTHLMAQVAALGFFVKRYLRPNMDILETSIVESLERLALDEDLDVSSVALAALHIARGEDPETRKFLHDLLSSLTDTDRAVRGRWVSAVQVFGDVYLERGEKWNAITLYLKALEVLPRHPGILLSLAWTYNSLGDYANAVEYYERSLEVHPHQPEVQADLDVARQNLARWRTR
jgi:hypothetical protein